MNSEMAAPCDTSPDSMPARAAGLSRVTSMTRTADACSRLKKRATRRYTENAEAYQVYLQGRYHWNKGTIEGYKKSIEYFKTRVT